MLHITVENVVGILVLIVLEMGDVRNAMVMLKDIKLITSINKIEKQIKGVKMKIHINKEKVEKKGLFGGGKMWYVVNAHYELNDEEKQLLNKNRNLLDMTVFDFPWRGPNGDTSGNSSPNIKQLTSGKDYPIGCVFSTGELQELEDIINEGARVFKSNLIPEQLGSSVKEI